MKTIALNLVFSHSTMIYESIIGEDNEYDEIPHEILIAQLGLHQFVVAVPIDVFLADIFSDSSAYGWRGIFVGINGDIYNESIIEECVLLMRNDEYAYLACQVNAEVPINPLKLQV